MRTLKKPTYSMAEIIEECTSNMREGSEKYLQAVPIITDYSDTFDNEMDNSNAWSLTSHDKVTSALNKDDMIDLYKYKFAKADQPGRKYYDQIKLSPVNGICPLCGMGDASTLDHYMAKSLFPTLAVTPINLIPACRDCNTIRGTQFFSSESDMTLHPYYDDLQETEWLAARIISLNPICIEYYVCDDFQDQPMRNRLEKHLEIFELDHRFAKKAAEEISIIKHYLSDLLDVGGIEALRDYFKLQYRILSKYEKNSWKSALYKALIEVDQHML